MLSLSLFDSRTNKWLCCLAIPFAFAKKRFSFRIFCGKTEKANSPKMASTSTVKTSIELPLGHRSAECIVKVPITAFEDDEEQIAAFNSKITAAVLKVAREATKSQQSNHQAMIRHLESSSNASVKISTTIRFHLFYNSGYTHIEMDRTLCLERALQLLADKSRLPVECFRMHREAHNVLNSDTPDSLGHPAICIPLVKCKLTRNRLECWAATSSM